MSSAQSLSILEVPELVCIIAQYLTLEEIANASLASKSLHNQLCPFLWKNVVIKKTLPTWLQFQNISPHIQSFQILRLLQFDNVEITNVLLSSSESTTTNTTVSPRTVTTSVSDVKEQRVFKKLREFTVSHSSGGDCSEEEDDDEENDIIASHYIKKFKELSLSGGNNNGVTNNEDKDDNNNNEDEDDNNNSEDDDALKDKDMFDTPHNAVMRFLNHCPNLTVLELPVMAILEPLLQSLNSQDTFFGSIPQLERLSLTGRYFPPECTPRLFKSCFQFPQLKDLSFHFEICHDQYKKGPKISDTEFNSVLEFLANTTSSSPTKITSLKLPVYEEGYPSAFLVTLIKQYIPNLEQFEVPRVDDNDPDIDLTDDLSGSLTKLQHLECSLFAKDADDETTAIAFIKASGGGVGIKSFKSLYFDDKDYLLDNRNVMSTLVSTHHKTLEEIELLYCEVLCSIDIKNIFTTCRKLKRYWVEPFNGAEVAIDFNDAAEGEWVCHDLKELYLTLNRSGENIISRYEEDDNNASDSIKSAKNVAKKVYAQIGRLTKLETLKLACDKSWGAEAVEKDYEYDFTLRRGHLAELAGLVELRHLHMATDFWYMMDQDDVEFIHANWPRLEKITFRSEGYYPPQEPFEEGQWQWLKKQRPDISMTSYPQKV
ncbi:hypothetical protein BGZ76_000819 [Entomortierella beljakovae]|nr:hypothetical protein BGZ76_000819 [Entomortierella beljakovae]